MTQTLNDWGRAAALAPDDNPICTFCSALATILTGDWELCDECACALTMPGPTCAECGGPLGEADVEAGETVCLECAPAGEVKLV